MSCSSRAGKAARLAAALLALSAALSGCVAGPNFVPPKVNGPARYTSAPLVNLPSDFEPELAAAPSATPGPVEAPWWTSLNSARLDATIREALARNHDLDAARATLGQAQEFLAVADAARYPLLDLDASAGRQKYGAAFLGPERLPPFSFYSIGASVSYAFDVSGVVRRTIEQQRANAEHEQHEVEAAALSLSGQVALQALAMASARAQI
ncbi:MAG: TolC family protein, partial [Steroidobacteraceae bacterium]